MQVIDVMQGSVPMCSPTVSVAEAARLMRDAAAGLVIVVSDGAPVGVLTDRDVVLKVVAADRLPSEVPLRDVMSAPVMAFCGTDDLRSAVTKLDRQDLHRAPVVSPDGHVIGLLSVDDVGRAAARALPEGLSAVLSAAARAG